MTIVSLSKLECPRCERTGTLEIAGDAQVGEDVPVECSACGRQHPARREPMDSAFAIGGDF